MNKTLNNASKTFIQEYITNHRIKSDYFMDAEYMRNYMKARRKARREKFIQMLGGKCIECGATDNLQFDHKNPKIKKHDFNDIQDANEKVIMKELEKCVLLCPSCHFEKTKTNNEFINKDKKPIRHGTIWAYKKWKCRCDKCKKAMSEYLISNK